MSHLIKLTLTPAELDRLIEALMCGPQSMEDKDLMVRLWGLQRKATKTVINPSTGRVIKDDTCDNT